MNIQIIILFVVVSFISFQRGVCSPKIPKDQWLRQYSGIAKTSQQVLAGNNARFTILSEAVIRMEFDPTGSFDDSQTINIVNRNVEMKLSPI